MSTSDPTNGISMTKLSSAQRRIHQAAMRLFAEKGSTQVSISDLAEYAGVARGTIYNNVGSLDHLFEEVAANLTAEMTELVTRSFGEVEDPAQRLAHGIRLFIRRAHEEPAWGYFLMTFAFNSESIRELWSGQPLLDVLNGLGQQRYQLRPEQLPSVMALVGGSVIAAMHLVRSGMKTWRDAGSDTVELVLRALGIGIEEARSLATSPLPEVKGWQ